MIQVLDGGLVAGCSSGMWIRLHTSAAIDTAPIAGSELVLDVGRNAKGVRHHQLPVRPSAPRSFRYVLDSCDDEVNGERNVVGAMPQGVVVVDRWRRLIDGGVNR